MRAENILVMINSAVMRRMITRRALKGMGTETNYYSKSSYIPQGAVTTGLNRVEVM